jgi:hypothetical protein
VLWAHVTGRATSRDLEAQRHVCIIVYAYDQSDGSWSELQQGQW